MKKLSIFDDPVLVTENEGFAVYKTSWTQNLTDYARKMDINGIELRGWTVTEVEDKQNGIRFYLLYDDQGRPRMDANSVEAMSLDIDMIKAVKTEENDIVEMAEKVRREKDALHQDHRDHRALEMRQMRNGH